LRVCWRVCLLRSCYYIRPEIVQENVGNGLGWAKLIPQVCHPCWPCDHRINWSRSMWLVPRSVRPDFIVLGHIRLGGAVQIALLIRCRSRNGEFIPQSGNLVALALYNPFFTYPTLD
jgi:hypothetical protein